MAILEVSQASTVSSSSPDCTSACVCLRLHKESIPIIAPCYSLRPLLLALSLLGLCDASAEAEQPLTLYESFLEGKNALLPDYSYAGYHRCEKPLPTVNAESHKLFDVTEFGAVASDRHSDRDAALAALDAAHAHSGPAGVYFPPGHYLLNEPDDRGKPPLQIKRSHIVLKGSGVKKTHLLFNEAPLFGQPLIHIRSSSTKQEEYWRGDTLLPGKVVERIDTFRVRVSDATGLEPGMRINMNAILDTKQASTRDYFAPHEVPVGILQSRNGKVSKVFELHEVKAVAGDVVTFVAPIHLDIPYFTNISIRTVENIVEECGIEDLSLAGGFDLQFKHHRGSRLGEDYRMIKLEHAFNCWVRRLRITNYSHAIATWLTGFNTFRDILLEGNAGHSSVTIYSSYGNLLAYIRENTDTHHGLGVARSACGTVFLRCVQYANMEAHCAFPRGTLYDCNQGRFEPRVGGAMFYPHHDKGLTFWNWRVTEPGNYDFWPEGRPYGYFMPPIVAGLHGANFDIADPQQDLLAIESRGRPTTPTSLFEAQLAKRLGELPPWLALASDEFESISRHSHVEIVTPKNHSSIGSKRAIRFRLKIPRELDDEHITRVDLLASASSVWRKYKKISQTDPKTLQPTFKPPHPGVWSFRALLTNSRGEITASRPVTLYLGNRNQQQPISVIEWAMIPEKARQDLYQDFVKQGGGEASRLPKSKSLQTKREEQPWYLFEKEYYDELQGFYASYATQKFKGILDKSEHVKTASKLFDGNLNTAAGSLYGSDVLVQAKFKEPTMINQLDIHWKSKAPAKPVRIDVQTSMDYPACWTSVVNDEPLWQSVIHVGGAIRRQMLHSKDRITTIYFPATQASAVRLILESFPASAATELKFYGPQQTPKGE